MIRAALTCLLALLMWPVIGPANAQDSSRWTQLTGDALRDAYNGQTLDLLYNTNGFTNQAHHTETHNPDGTTDYREGELRLDGRWKLVGPPGFEDQICYRYPALDAARQHCFFIFRDGRCLYGYSARYYGKAQYVIPEGWRSKGANREDGPSCDILIS